MNRFACATVLSCFFVSALADANTQRPLSVISNPAKSIIVTRHDRQFNIVLKSNPSTGYTWVLNANYNAKLMQPVSHQYYPPANSKVGAGGVEVFRFKVAASVFRVPHLLHIQFHYRRSWAASENAQTMKFTVQTAT